MGFIKQTHLPDAPVVFENAEAILSALHAPEVDTRRLAARAAAAHPQHSAALCAHLEIETDPAVNASLLTALIKTQDAAVAGCLLRYLRSENVGLRNDVISALQQMPQAIEPHMPELLRDSDMDVRIFALNILGGMRNLKARDWILEVIANDSQMNVCTTALDALAEIGTPDMIPALEALAARFDNDYVRFAVDVAIRRIKA